MVKKKLTVLLKNLMIDINNFITLKKFSHKSIKLLNF